MTPFGRGGGSRGSRVRQKWRWDSVLGPFRRGLSSPFFTTAALFGGWRRRNGGGRGVCASALFLRRLRGAKVRLLAELAAGGEQYFHRCRLESMDFLGGPSGLPVAVVARPCSASVSTIPGGSKNRKIAILMAAQADERKGQKVTITNFFPILQSTSQTRHCLAPRAPGESSSWRRGAPTVS